MPEYVERFAVGAEVRIEDASVLKSFAASWKLHNPLKPEQLAFAGKLGVVTEVGFYHGGDPLYQVAGAPGVWHEVCLRAP